MWEFCLFNHPMLSSSTDFAFFSSPLPSSSTSPVIVKTRIRSSPSIHGSSTSNTPARSSPLPRPASSPPFSSPLSQPLPSSNSKRKLIDTDPIPPVPLPREIKRPRAPPKKKPRKRTPSSSASSRVQSRAQSRQCVPAPSPEPIYRSDRSRSTSLFPGLDSDAPLFRRRWRTDESGDPGDSFLSSEIIVKRLMKSYKACACFP